MAGERNEDKLGNQFYSVGSCLSPELLSAIKSGDMSQFSFALDRQPLNEFTEAVSNLLLLHDFLYEQSMDLIELSDALEWLEDTKDILIEVGGSIKTMEERYQATFLSEDTSSEYANLQGDDYLRYKLLPRIDEGGKVEYITKSELEDIRTITMLDFSVFSAPKDIFDDVVTMSRDMIADLRIKANMVLETGANEGAVESLRDTIEHYREIVDGKMNPSLFEDDEEQFV